MAISTIHAFISWLEIKGLISILLWYVLLSYSAPIGLCCAQQHVRMSQ